MRDDLLRVAANRALKAQAHALELNRAGHLAWVADDPDCPDVMRLAALAEELGEVARCLHDNGGNLRDELDQLAGIALAWSSVAPDPAQLRLG